MSIPLFSLSPPSLNTYSLFPSPKPLQNTIYKTPVRASSNSSNGVTESPKRRGRPKGSSKSPSSLTKKTKGSSQNPDSGYGSVLSSDEDEEFDDGMDFPYLDPPLICCFGAVKKEFLPTVRVAEHQMHPDIYSEWKMLQWKPPEFNRAPGGPPSNVAISHVRLGGRAEFMGKVGRDEFGEELVYMMNKERVQTRAVKFDSNVKTACSYMKVKFGDDGKLRMESAKEAAEDALLPSELNLAVLKEKLLLVVESKLSKGKIWRIFVKISPAQGDAGRTERRRDCAVPPHAVTRVRSIGAIF